MILRPAAIGDINALSELIMALGYSVEPAICAARLRAILAAPGHHVWITQGDRIDGLLHCFARPSLERGRDLVVQALIVAKHARFRGNGRRLLEKAEAVAILEQCESVCLFANSGREAAHRFYRHLGYNHESSSEFLRKPIPTRPKGAPGSAE